MFSLRMLGGVRLTGPSGPVTGPAAQPARLALLVQLAVADGRVSREMLVHRLWPDREENQGRRNLSDALYVLRQELDEDALVASGDALRLDPGVVTTDVAAFERALERGAAREAVELYGGPFLDGAHLRDTVPFERWVDEHRGRLARAYAEALESLAQTAEEVGDAKEAVRWRRALAAERPFSTADVLSLMRALERAGDPAAALEAGHLHAERLRKELGAKPDPRLTAELERIRTAPESGETALPAVGRSQDVASSRANEGPPARELPRPEASDRSSEVADERTGAAPSDETTSLFLGTGSGIAIAAGLLLTVVLGVLMVVSDRTGSPATTVDPGRVAIFPFRVGGASPALAYLEEGMVDLLAARLSGETGPGAVDPRAAIAAWRRHEVDQGPPLTTDRIREVAAKVGAGASVVGEVVGTEEQLTVTARLQSGNPSAGSVVEEVTGPADSLPILIDRLAARMLIGISGTAAPTLGSLTTHRLPALKAYLAGREAWRRGRTDDAIRRYEEALDHDTAFALAAVALAEAASRLPGGIATRHPLVRRGLRLARSHRERLNPEERRYLDALSKPRYPAGMFPMDEVIALWTDVAHELRDRPEAWYRLGRHVAEFGPQLGIEDAHDLAASQLSRAVRLDSTFLPPLRHLIWIAARQGDSRALQRLAPLYLRQEPAGPVSGYTRWRIALARRDEGALADLRAEFDAMSAASLALIVGFGQVDGVGLDDVRRAARTLERRVRDRRMQADPAARRVNLYVLKNLAANRGQPRRADSLLRLRWEGRLSARGYQYDRIFAAIYEDGMSAGAGEAVRRLERADATGTYGVLEPATEAEQQAADRCVLWQWHLWRGDTLGAADAIRRVRGDEPIRDAPCAAVLEILLAAERGGAAAEGARPMARAYLDDAWLWPVGFMVSFAAARLYERLGEPAAAVDALRRRPYRAVQGSWTLGHALFEIGRLSLARGDTAGAVAAYRHWLALQDRAEESRRTRVDRVRSLLDRLGS